METWQVVLGSIVCVYGVGVIVARAAYGSWKLGAIWPLVLLFGLFGNIQ